MVSVHRLMKNRDVAQNMRPKYPLSLRSKVLLNHPPATAPIGIAIVILNRVRPPSRDVPESTVLTINGIVTSVIIREAP